jgi:hypothetical protein
MWIEAYGRVLATTLLEKVNIDEDLLFKYAKFCRKFFEP